MIQFVVYGTQYIYLCDAPEKYGSYHKINPCQKPLI